MKVLIKLFDVLEEKQKELNKRIENLEIDANQYNDIKAKVKALEWVKRLIAKESEDEDLEIDNYIMLGKEWG